MVGGHGGTTYKGYTIPANKRWHTIAGKGLCATMWFWIFYRAKQDGAGLRHPWDGHGNHSHGHGHANGHEFGRNSPPPPVNLRIPFFLCAFLFVVITIHYNFTTLCG